MYSWKDNRVKLFSVIMLAALSGNIVTPVYAELSSLEGVTALNRRGKHLEAVAEFRKLSAEQNTLAVKIAAAQSAWAAGVVDLSRDLWTEILANRDFKGIERHRAVLALAILELQENNPERARYLAEQVLPEVQTSDLKAQLLLLIGESLTEQGLHSKAEGYYQEAAQVGNDVLRSEAKFLYGENQLSLGRTEGARKSFTEVETASEYAPQALFQLIKIDLDQGQYNGVLTWIKEGREEFPMQFEDSWIRYANIIALANTKQLNQCVEELKTFKARYSDQDTWYVLANSEYEGKELVAELDRLNKKESPTLTTAELALADLATVAVPTKKTVVTKKTAMTTKKSKK
ncbi:MAG: hypothetical protein IT292_09590 [Deltaproteobacteria bacterium]|nr:hypothetical protein [Deltaproteobacteria bacterium]